MDVIKQKRKERAELELKNKEELKARHELKKQADKEALDKELAVRQPPLHTYSRMHVYQALFTSALSFCL